jgi:ribosome-binding protein aMBF1 (putative translation factor)
VHQEIQELIENPTISKSDLIAWIGKKEKHLERIERREYDLDRKRLFRMKREELMDLL